VVKVEAINTVAAVITTADDRFPFLPRDEWRTICPFFLSVGFRSTDADHEPLQNGP
jgi:hypothetical protein